MVCEASLHRLLVRQAGLICQPHDTVLITRAIRETGDTVSFDHPERNHNILLRHFDSCQRISEGFSWRWGAVRHALSLQISQELVGIPH